MGAAGLKSKPIDAGGRMIIGLGFDLAFHSVALSLDEDRLGVVQEAIEQD
jgi:hypothetical protein